MSDVTLIIHERNYAISSMPCCPIPNNQISVDVPTFNYPIRDASLSCVWIALTTVCELYTADWGIGFGPRKCGIKVLGSKVKNGGKVRRSRKQSQPDSGLKRKLPWFCKEYNNYSEYWACIIAPHLIVRFRTSGNTNSFVYNSWHLCCIAACGWLLLCAFSSYAHYGSM